MTRDGSALRGGVGVLAVLALSALAACSSSGSGGTTPTTAGGTSASTSGGGGGVATASALVAKYTPQATSIQVTTPVAGSIPAGKTIDFLDCGTPACHQLYLTFTSAATLLKWTVKDINQGFTPETVHNAWSQVLANPPDGVVTTGQPTSAFASQMAQLNGVPVVDCCTTNTPTGNLKLVVNDAELATLVGKLQAAVIAKDSGGTGSVVSLSTPFFPVLGTAEDSLKKNLAAFCTSCSFDTLDLAATDLGSPTLPTKVVGYLRAHPSVTYVVAGFDDEFIGLPAALSAAGLSGKVKLIGADPSPTELGYIKSGQEFASVSYATKAAMYLLADGLARIFTGSSPLVDHVVLPPQVLTKDNIQSTQEAPDVQGYEAQFKALWGLS
jgi:ribose transport system substrate-binding protein